MAQVDNLAPALEFINVTPSDTARIQVNGSDVLIRGILLGVAGDIALKNQRNETVILSGWLAGLIYPVSSYQILATGTTATDISVYL